MVNCRAACHATVAAAAYGGHPSPAHREGPGRGLRYCCPGQAAQLTNSPLGSNIFSAKCQHSEVRAAAISLSPKLLAICEKLHNLGIYSYGLGEWIVMLRKPRNNTLSITCVRASLAYIRSVTDRPFAERIMIKETLSVLPVPLTSLLAGCAACAWNHSPDPPHPKHSVWAGSFRPRSLHTMAEPLPSGARAMGGAPVIPPIASPHVAGRSTTVPRLDRGTAAISSVPLARPDANCHGRFLLWPTLLAISAVCKKFDWRRYRCP